MLGLALFVVGLAVGAAVAWKLRDRRELPALALVPAGDAPAGDESELARSTADRERRLLRIVEALPLGVLVFDEEGSELFTNEAAGRLTADRLHQALVESAVEELMADASAGHVAQRTLDLYGAPRTQLSIRAVPVDEAVVGRAAVVVTIEDTTELRSADLLRRDFVANVSHELKTPIGAIGVLAETLVDVDDPEVAHRLAGRLQNESYRLATTIDDLLTLARIESGEQTDLGEVAISDVFGAVAGRVGFMSGEKAIVLDFSVDPGDLVVLADRVQLISGIGNLVDNAVKYSESGSTVTIDARRAGPNVTITVADEGVGIPEADVERIFERFYRVDRGRSRDTGGTGLGLSIVRHVLLNHGGSIEVESEEGVGTTFVVSLPSGPSGGSRSAESSDAYTMAPARGRS